MIDEAFHLTPLDVRRYDFGRALRGYDPARVDQFRDQVADEMERLARVNQDLDGKARSFHEQLRAFRERDKALNEALVSAQQMRQETQGAGGTRSRAHRSRSAGRRRAHARGRARRGAPHSEPSSTRSIARAARTSRRCASLIARHLSEIDASDHPLPDAVSPSSRWTRLRTRKPAPRQRYRHSSTRPVGRRSRARSARALERRRLFRAAPDASRQDVRNSSSSKGRPTANGRPGIHHVFARTVKDLFCRHRAMKGFHVTRKAGWDTHGLPVEIEVEKQLGISRQAGHRAHRRRAVQRSSAARACSSIARTGNGSASASATGSTTTIRTSRTRNNYVESVWWALKTLFDRGRLYRGHKILPYCARCGTALSSHEVAQGYKTVKDPTSMSRSISTVTGETTRAAFSCGRRRRGRSSRMSRSPLIPSSSTSSSSSVGTESDRARSSSRIAPRRSARRRPHRALEEVARMQGAISSARRIIARSIGSRITKGDARDHRRRELRLGR